MSPIIAAPLLLAACNGLGNEDVLTDAMNYYFTSTITADPIVVKAGVDQPIDWSALTTDLLGREMVPEQDVDDVVLSLLLLPKDEVLAALEDDSLEQKDLAIFAETFPSNTSSIMLSDLMLLGTTPFTPDDPKDGFLEKPDDQTYLLSLLDSKVSGARMLAVLSPQDEATDEGIYLQPDSAGLTYEIDLLHGEPYRPESLVIEWSGLTKTGWGSDLVINALDQLMVARYDETIEELEANFLQIESLHEEIWSASISDERSFDLTTLVSDQGNPFTGFDTNSTWLLAFRCTECYNPAPPFLTVVDASGS